MSAAIPIQNIYYLLIYAWDRLAEGQLVDVSEINSTELVDLYATVLIKGINHLARRGLDQGYLPISADIAGIRGRVQMAETARRMLPQHGRTSCMFDELSVDTLNNQILRGAIRRLLKAEEVDKELHKQLGQLDRGLASVSVVPLTKRLFRKVQLHGNSRFYRFLLNVCELVVDSALATEASGSVRFRDFIRDPDKMPALFEKFVFNFYRIECPGTQVTRERIKWSATSETDPDLTFLPSMLTDVTIRFPGKTVVVDAKYYQKSLQRYYESETVHSGNLYQLYAYLKNLEPRGGQDASAEGVLLYPAVSEKLDLGYVIDDHKISVRTVDLGKPWRDIKNDLMKVVS